MKKHVDSKSEARKVKGLYMKKKEKEDKCEHKNCVAVDYRCCFTIECTDCSETISRDWKDNS